MEALAVLVRDTTRKHCLELNQSVLSVDMDLGW